MSCRECHHPVDDILHDFCRTHAHCSRDGQYYRSFCEVCEELWERAANIDAPEDALVAFDALARWIKGFRKNSKHRPKGQSHFFDVQERTDFQDLHAIIANLREIRSQDQPQQQAVSQSVSSNFLLAL